MKPLRISVSVAVVALTATLSCFAQSSFLGPMLTTTLSTSVGAGVASYGTPSRFSFGGQYSRVSATGSELTFTLHHRSESGGFLTDYKKTSGGIIGRLNVIDIPIGQPTIVTTLESSSIELGAGLRFPIIDLDTADAKLLFQFGVSADYLTSMQQISDFSRIPEADRPGIPVQSTIVFAQQAGFGGQFGIAAVAPVGGSRLLIELLYTVRQPTTIPFPTGITSAEQNISWLTGRGIRLGLSYQFKI